MSERAGPDAGAKSRDSLHLILSALIVCVVGVGSGLIADRFHLSWVWFFLLWNSIGISALFIDDFGNRVKQPSFAVFLIVWALLHGCLVVLLMRWMTILKMVPFLAIELFVGYLLAIYLFDARPADDSHDSKPPKAG